MDTKQTVVCLLVLLVVIATICKADLVDNDFEENSLYDARRALLEKLLKRDFQKRPTCSFLTKLY